MKIYVLGSTAFVKEMVESVDVLKENGHDGYIRTTLIMSCKKIIQISKESRMASRLK